MPIPVGGHSGWPHVTAQPHAPRSFLPPCPQQWTWTGVGLGDFHGRQGRNSSCLSFCFWLFSWSANAACRILVPQLRIESTASSVKVKGPNHCRTTRGFPVGHFLSLADGPEVWHWHWQPSMGQALMKLPNIALSLTSGSAVTMAHNIEISGGRENWRTTYSLHSYSFPGYRPKCLPVNSSALNPSTESMLSSFLETFPAEEVELMSSDSS